MPVYQYQDKHYELPDGLTTDQALSKIKSHLGQQPEEDGFFKQALGVGEGVASAVSGVVSAIPRGIRTLGELAATGDLGQALERSESSGDAATYSPRTKAGKDVSKSINNTFSQYSQDFSDKYAGDVEYLNKQKEARGEKLTAEDYAAEAKERGAGEIISNLYVPGFRMPGKTIKPKPGLDMNKFASEQQGVDTSPQLNTRQKGAQGELFPDTSVTETINKKDNTVVPGAASQYDPFQEQSQYTARSGTSGQMDLPLPDPDMPPVIRQNVAGVGTLGTESPGLVQAVRNGAPQDVRVFDEMQQQLQAGQQSPVDTTLPRGGALEDMASQIRASESQRLVQERQSAIQQQMNQSQGLAFNADERARQQAAPVPGLAEDQAAQAQALQEQQQRSIQEQQAQDQQEQATQQQAQASQEASRPAAFDQAQQAVDQRQQQMEFDVKRQQTADFNAAERARQENAPVAGIDNAHVNEFKGFQERLKEADTDPTVVAATDKVRQAEELYTRVADGMQNGLQHPNENILKRLEMDIQHFEDAAKDARATVALEANNPLKNHPISSAGPIGRQRGAVDMGPLREAISTALDHVMKLAGDLPPVKTMLDSFHGSNDPQIISVTRKVLKAEGADPKVLNALDNALMAAHKLQLGKMENAINPIRKISPGGKQTGAILLESNKKKALDNLATKIGIEDKLGEISASQWTPDEAVRQAKLGKDVDQNMAQRFINNFTKGGLYQALKMHNPMIRYVVEKIQEADRLSRASTRDWVHARLAPAMRALNPKEQAQVWHAIEIADLSQRPLDYEALARAGASEAQIHLAKELREALDFGYDQVNRARKAAGKDPIDKRTAYAAMRATGDFRRIVYDKAGDEKRVIGVISSNYRRRVEGLKGEMEGKGFHVGEERYFGSNVKDRNSSNQAFMSAIEHLADNDPRVADFVDVLNQLRTSEVYSYLNAKKHTLAKKGVQGMDGRKSWMSPEENAADGFKSQLAYMEATIKWGNLSEAAAAIKPVMTDKSVNMPIAKEWSERYLKNALGFNPSEVGAHLDAALSAAFKNTGVGYSVYRKGVATTRQVTNGLLLMLNPRFWLTNLVQLLQAQPGMKAMLIARGLDHGFDFGTGYSYLAQAANTIMKKNTGMSLEGFEKNAIKYAQSHHVYGSDMIEHSNSIRKNAGHYAEKTSNFMAGSIEGVTRQLAFYSFVHMLKENGMSEGNGLHTAAHNLTDMMMNNYSAVDRPSIYHSLGPVGEVAVNLQSYKHNELSRISLFARHVQEYKSVRPIVAHMTAGLVYGGIMGTLAYDQVDSAYHAITKIMGKPDSLSNRVLSMSEGLGKHLYDATGGRVDLPYAASHGVFSAAGMDMTRSLGLTDLVGNTVSDIGFPGVSKLGEAAKAGYNLTGLPGGDPGSGPTEMNAKRFVRAAAPTGFQGTIDNQWFTKPNGLAVRPRDLAGQAYKNSTDTALKYGGFSGVNEAVQRQKTFNIERQSRDYADMRDNVLGVLRDQVYTGNIKGSTIQKYLDAQGSPKTLETDLKKYAEQQNMSAEQLNLMHSAVSKSIAQRMKALEYVRMFDDHKH